MNNKHVIELIYLRATNFKSSRLKLKSHRFNESIIVAFDSYRAKPFDQAIDELKSLGYTIHSIGDLVKSDVFLVEEFKSIKQSKKERDENTKIN